MFDQTINQVRIILSLDMSYHEFTFFFSIFKYYNPKIPRYQLLTNKQVVFCEEASSLL